MKKFINRSRDKFKKEKQLRSFARKQIDLKRARRFKASLHKIRGTSPSSSAFTKFKIYDIVY